MYARLTHMTIKPESTNDAGRIAMDETLPSLQADPGFRGAFIFGNRETGDSYAVTLWESTADEEASRPKVAERLSVLKDFMAGPPDQSMIFEVIASHLPSATPAPEEPTTV